MKKNIRSVCYCLLLLLPVLFASAQQPNDSTERSWIENARTLRLLMQSDPHRPVFHFVNPEGYAMPFDPNGAIFWKGKYHLGYIYQTWRRGKMEHFWGHVVSTDLLHWTLYPDMLNVQPGDMEEGIFSGGAFLSREGVPHIMYHGQGAAANLVAWSKDPDLKVWQKFDGNPVLKTTVTDHPRDPKGQKYTAWDPEGWYDKEADAYYQISGGNVPALFKSPDMYKWTYLGDLIDSNRTMRDKTEDLSCPDMFRIGKKAVLLFISHNIGTQYYIGSFAHDRFIPEKHGRMNWPGGTFFAPEQLVDDKGRNIIWGWVLERKPAHLKKFGWSGIMSLPRVLTLSPENDMLIAPPEELASIRLDSVKTGPLSISPGGERELPFTGNVAELYFELDPGNAKQFGIKVLCSPDQREETVVRFEPGKNEIVVDFEKSSVAGPVTMPSHVITTPSLPGFPEKVSKQVAPFSFKPGERLQVRVFIDKSIVEIFINGRQCITQVVYPELAGSNRVKVFSTSGNLTVKQFKGWHLAETNAW